MNASALILSGFGLFFIGIRLLGEHLQQLASRRVRQRLARAVSRPGVAPLAGIGLGALVQSTSGVTFLVMSLLKSGIVGMAPAMTVLAWSNVGTAVLVLLSAFNLKLVALYMLGLCGFGFFQGYDRRGAAKHLVYAVLGLALLFLGLAFIKEGVNAGRGDPWVEATIHFVTENGAIALLVGIVGAMAAQSATTVTIAALPLVHAGLLPEEHLALIVYGANAGSGLGVMIMSARIEGSARQLGLFQGLLKIVTAVLFLLLYGLETYAALPLVETGVNAITPVVGTRIALLYLLFQIVGALLGQLLQRPIQRLLEHVSPPTVEEVLARPHYLFDEALSDPDTALSLVEREQARLVGALPHYLDDLRRGPDTHEGTAIPVGLRLEGDKTIGGEIDHFLSEMIAMNPAYDGLEQIFEARTRQRNLDMLRTSVHEFADQTAATGERADHSLADNMVEALHLLLDLVADLSRAGDAADLAMLRQLTESRSEMMDGIRRKMLSETATPQTREALLVAMMLFERSVWHIHTLSVAFETVWMDALRNDRETSAA